MTQTKPMTSPWSNRYKLNMTNTRVSGCISTIPIRVRFFAWAIKVILPPPAPIHLTSSSVHSHCYEWTFWCMDAQFYNDQINIQLSRLKYPIWKVHRPGLKNSPMQKVHRHATSHSCMLHIYRDKHLLGLVQCGVVRHALKLAVWDFLFLRPSQNATSYWTPVVRPSSLKMGQIILMSISITERRNIDRKCNL